MCRIILWVMIHRNEYLIIKYGKSVDIFRQFIAESCHQWSPRFPFRANFEGLRSDLIANAINSGRVRILSHHSASLSLSPSLSLRFSLSTTFSVSFSRSSGYRIGSPSPFVIRFRSATAPLCVAAD